MRTRNSYFPNNSSVTIPRHRNKRRTPNVVKPELRTIVKVAPMVDNRTMEELLQAPTEGDVPNDVIKLMMFPYSLEGAARVWYDKEPPNSILAWEDLVNKFVNQFFPPSKTTHLKNEISRFTQRFEETFREAWERFKEMLRAENTSMTDDRIDKLADQILSLVDIFAEKVVTPATVKVVEESCVTCGGPHAHYNCDATNSNQSSVCAATVSRIDVIDVAREEYAQEIICFSNNSLGGNTTSNFEPIIFDSSLSLTLFEGSDVILEEIEAYLKDESISPEINHANCDPEGDICLIEKLLNDDPFQLPSMDLKQGEVAKEKYLIEEPLKLELKDLPLHLEYAYLEGEDKLPVIIAKDLKDN
uniref:Reverse transcriptase domain-containing protein n=1 Tax=Tanacetum cinerariifolium TaxID=118510 RepID=A0A6L2LZJ6_TANCI|nr:reverse transcriptase domain-containing protein [Tanacetum cinerariifolium]